MTRFLALLAVVTIFICGCAVTHNVVLEPSEQLTATLQQFQADIGASIKVSPNWELSELLQNLRMSVKISLDERSELILGELQATEMRIEKLLRELPMHGEQRE